MQKSFDYKHYTIFDSNYKSSIILLEIRKYTINFNKNTIKFFRLNILKGYCI